MKKLTAKEPKPTAPTNAANQPSTRFGSAIIVQVVRISCFDFFYEFFGRKEGMAYSKIRHTPHYLVLIPSNLCLKIL